MSTDRRDRGKKHWEIAATLGTEILSGERKPDSRIPSPEQMFKRFGVSRVVVREVVRTLVAKGLVTSRPRVGTKVSDPSTWNWLDPSVLEWRAQLGLDNLFLAQISQLRLALEPAAASLAAENRTENDLKVLKAAIKGMYRAGADHKKFSAADRDFHTAVIVATHNPFFYSANSATSVTIFQFLSLISAGAENKVHLNSAARHECILNAIIANDPRAAAYAMTQVIKDGLEHARAHLAD